MCVMFWQSDNVRDFTRDSFLDNSDDFYFIFELALLNSAFGFLLLLFRYQSTSSLYAVFDAVSLGIGAVLFASPSTNAFVYGGFQFHM